MIIGAGLLRLCAWQNRVICVLCLFLVTVLTYRQVGGGGEDAEMCTCFFFLQCHCYMHNRIFAEVNYGGPIAAGVYWLHLVAR